MAIKVESCPFYRRKLDVCGVISPALYSEIRRWRTSTRILPYKNTISSRKANSHFGRHFGRRTRVTIFYRGQRRLGSILRDTGRLFTLYQATTKWWTHLHVRQRPCLHITEHLTVARGSTIWSSRLAISKSWFKPYRKHLGDNERQDLWFCRPNCLNWPTVIEDIFFYDEVIFQAIKKYYESMPSRI